MSLLLKPSEYKGTENTAVAGRVVMVSEHELSSSKLAATQSESIEGRGKGSAAADVSKKVEVHLAGVDLVSEVVYVEAWGDHAEQLAQHCRVGDIVSIAGVTFIPSQHLFTASRLPYHLRVKGTVNLVVHIKKLETLPWGMPPVNHPLVQLKYFGRVTRGELICVVVRIERKAEVVERLTPHGRQVSACDAVAWQEGETFDCLFWQAHAHALGAISAGDTVLLYSVLVDKKGHGPGELFSWRGTQVLLCPDELRHQIKGGMPAHVTDLRTQELLECKGQRLLRGLPYERHLD